MTKKEFDLKYCGEKVAVNCDTEEKSKAFLKLAKSFGYKWRSGDDLDLLSCWDGFKNKTCYVLRNNRITYERISTSVELNRTIVEFELDEETFNIGDVVYSKDGRKGKIVDISFLISYEDTGFRHYKEQNELTKKKPLKKITKEQLKEMGYELE